MSIVDGLRQLGQRLTCGQRNRRERDVLLVELFLHSLEFIFGWDGEWLVERVDVREIERPGKGAAGFEAGGRALLDALIGSHVEPGDGGQLLLRPAPRIAEHFDANRQLGRPSVGALLACIQSRSFRRHIVIDRRGHPRWPRHCAWHDRTWLLARAQARTRQLPVLPRSAPAPWFRAVARA